MKSIHFYAFIGSHFEVLPRISITLNPKFDAEKDKFYTSVYGVTFEIWYFGVFFKF